MYKGKANQSRWDDSAAARQPDSLLAREMSPNLTGNGSRHFTLHREDTAQFA